MLTLPSVARNHLYLEADDRPERHADFQMSSWRECDG